MVLLSSLSAPLDQTFGPLRSYPSGAKFIPLASDPLIITYPAMTAPFGVSKFDDKGKPTLVLNVEDPAALAGLTLLDEWARTAIKANSQEWLGKRDISNDLLDVVYCPALKPSKGNYSPTTKLVLKFDEEEEPKFDHGGVRRGYGKGEYTRFQVKSLVQVTGIWVAGGRLGLSVNTLKIHVAEPLETSPARLDFSNFLFDEE